MPISGFSLVNYDSASEADRRGGSNLFPLTLVAHFPSHKDLFSCWQRKEDTKGLKGYIPYHFLLTAEAKEYTMQLGSSAEIKSWQVLLLNWYAF